MTYKNYIISGIEIIEKVWEYINNLWRMENSFKQYIINLFGDLTDIFN